MTVGADSELVKALSDKLMDDPSYPIPEGYFRHVERYSVYEYKIPEPIVSQLS